MKKTVKKKLVKHFRAFILPAKKFAWWPRKNNRRQWVALLDDGWVLGEWGHLFEHKKVIREQVKLLEEDWGCKIFCKIQSVSVLQ